MWRQPLLIFLLSTACNCVLEVHKSAMEDCVISSENFWTIYRSHFVQTKALSVTLLFVNEHRADVRRFTDVALKNLRKHNHPMTVEVHEKFLLRYTETQNRPDYSPRKAATPLPKLKPITLDQLLGLKRLSSDATEGHVIVVWNEEILQKFLDQDHKIIIPKARATYAVFFVSPNPGDCSEAKEKLNNVLVRFWKQYHVVDAVFQSPCSCRNDVIYVYHPFYRISKSAWGVIGNYTMDQVLDNFRLITNPVTNLNQFPLRVSLFVRRPTAVTAFPKLLAGNPIYRDLSRSKGFGGQDGSILSEIANYLNFQVKLVPIANDITFGTVLPNGTITGSLGDVVSQRVLISANGRFLTDYDTDEIEFTLPYSNDEICAVTRKSKKVPQWMMFFNCFSLASWFAIFFIGIVSTVFWYCLKHFECGKSCLEKRNDGLKTWWEIFSFLVGIPIRIIPSWTQLPFLYTCLFFSVVILGIVQGSFFKAFTTVTFYKDINTLEELDQAGLPIATSLGILNDDTSELMISLKRKTFHFKKNALEVIASGQNIATLQRKRDLKLFIQIQYMSSKGEPLLNMVNECLSTYFMAYIVPKGSPLLTIFNHVLTKLIESGLTEKWYDDVVDALIAEKMMSLQASENGEKPFSLKDIQVAFYLLLVGLSSALLVFLGEIASKKCKKSRYSIH